MDPDDLCPREDGAIAASMKLGKLLRTGDPASTFGSGLSISSFLLSYPHQIHQDPYQIAVE
jgi:hypothetical protein